MLSIGKLGSDPDPSAYYLEVVASGVEDYYLSADEVPGRWLGPAASNLGRPRSRAWSQPYATSWASSPTPTRRTRPSCMGNWA
jgi:hypothetical protein